uniref:Secreted protein n=1 Tax=Trypanosoma congolense (strain IL3000) TaxID=1068625 RepID=G0V1H5_TRYCI|nr:hypothetical protein, unlikely [Trypanosoma congolense IL3000]
MSTRSHRSGLERYAVLLLLFFLYVKKKTGDERAINKSVQKNTGGGSSPPLGSCCYAWKFKQKRREPEASRYHALRRGVRVVGKTRDMTAWRVKQVGNINGDAICPEPHKQNAATAAQKEEETNKTVTTC